VNDERTGFFFKRKKKESKNPFIIIHNN
jgi:hypothetical protein